MWDKWKNSIQDCPAVRYAGSFRDKTSEEHIYGALSALLLRSAEMGGDIEEVLAECGLKLPDRSYRVVLISVFDEKLQAMSGKERHFSQIHIYDEIRLKLLETIGDSADGFLFLLSGFLIAILYETGQEFSVARWCREAAEYADISLGVHINVDISTRRSGVKNMSQAYRMIQDLESSRQFYTGMINPVYEVGDSTIERITDRSQRTEFEQGFSQTAGRVCGSLRALSAESASEHIREQLLRIAQNCVGMPYPTSLTLTVNRFISVLQYTLATEDLADLRFLIERDFSRDLAESPDLETFLAQADTIGAQLMEHARQRFEDAHDRMMRDLRRYVEENATDPNMGLSLLAKEFRIAPREIAESFREYYGLRVNDVVHQVRVKKAKELLLTTGDTVQTIAEKVGYCSLATMYRAFVQIEGVPPAKLRKSRDT